MQKTISKISLFLTLSSLIIIIIACDNAQSGRATYTFTNQVSEEFMDKQREKVEGMAGENTSVEDIMKMVKDVNSERIYTLLFQENRTVFSLDKEWLKKEDPNKIYIDYQAKQLVLPREGNVRKDSFPNVNWQITKETKTIGKWHTQKAIAEFDGQKITAWFAKDDNLRITPKHYVGLEGIVVELELETGSKYTLTNLEFDNSVKVILP